MLNLAEYRKRPQRLADYLPWAALVAEGVVLNKDGALQRSARFRGPDLESATDSGLIAACARLNGVLCRCGSGWALFFDADRTPARAYPASDWPDPVSWLVDQERRADFESEGRHYESHYHLTLCYLPPADRVSHAERWLLETPPAQRDFDARDHLDRFITQTDRLFDLLADSLPEFAPLDDAQTLAYLHATVSAKRHPLAVPEVPMYLDALLPDSALTGGLEPMLGDRHLRVVSLLGFPGSTTPGLLDALNHLGISYRWSTRFLPLDKPAAAAALRKYRRQWFAKRKSIGAILKEVMTNEPSVLVDTDADNKALDADAALQELGDDDVAYGYFTVAVVLWDEDVAAVREKVRAVERIVNGLGFVTIHERVNAVDAWLGTLPGHAYANIRQPLLSTLNLAHLLPLSAVWAGPARNDHLDGPPLLLAKTNGNTPFRLVTHVGDVGHTMIVGPTGAGKSVLLSLIALQYRRYPDSQVFLFDRGGSALGATVALGGRFYALGGEDSELAFQPLATVDDHRERVWAAEWLRDLLARDGVAITPEVKDTLWSALTSLAAAPRQERTLTGLSLLLQHNALTSALQPYTLQGPFGHLLDADCDSLDQADVQCFEMEALAEQKSAVLPVLTYLFHCLEARFTGRPTLLVLDEVWAFLDHPTFAERLRAWLKTLRKKNVAVIFATQSLSDIGSSAIAPALIESCPSRIFLPNEHALEPQEQETYRRFGLNPRQIGIVARATPKRDYYYQSARGNRLFELGLGPVALAFCGASRPADLELIRETLRDAGSVQDYRRLFLQRRGLDWAAELLADFPAAGEGA